MEKKNATVLVVVVGVLALLFGCVLGALAGGTAAYLLAAPRDSRIQGPALRITPEFQIPTIPDMPVVPGERMGAVYALVTVVTPGSPAEEAGIQVGDVITRFDGDLLDPEGPVTMITAYEPGDIISITVQRGTEELDLELTLGDNPSAPGKAWLGITYQAVSGGMERFMRPDGE
ncbi:MAG: PDZ domain-containing protein [Anaerolineae bacterium]